MNEIEAIWFDEEIREISAAMLEDIDLQRDVRVSRTIMGIGREKVRAIKFPFQYMEIPKLKLADSALWMWKLTTNAADPMPHPLLHDMWKVESHKWIKTHPIDHPNRQYPQ